MAIGPHPRYLEALRIGGGYGDPAGGGADFEPDGTVRTDGPMVCGNDAAPDRTLRIVTANEYDAALALDNGDPEHGGALWFDGAGQRLSLGTRDGEAAAIEALRIDRGSQDVALLGDVRVAGGVLADGGAPGLGTESLLALWRCDGDASVVRDWSGAGDDLTPGGSGAAAAPGKFGSALDFDGAGYAAGSDVIPSTYGSADLALSLWFNTTEIAGNQVLAGWYGGSSGEIFELSVDGNGRAALTLRDADSANLRSVRSDVSLADGRWRHAVGVRESGVAIRLYIDGDLAEEASDSGGAVHDTTPFVLGARSGSSLFFTGALDEVAVWSKALGLSEVRALYAMTGTLAHLADGRRIGGDLRVEGDLAAAGGRIGVGEAGAERGELELAHGAGGSAPGCILLRSPNGTAYYLFVEDDGTVRVSETLPEQNTDGEEVGLQF